MWTRRLYWALGLVHGGQTCIDKEHTLIPMRDVEDLVFNAHNECREYRVGVRGRADIYLDIIMSDLLSLALWCRGVSRTTSTNITNYPSLVPHTDYS
jgi:hypothetical protein